MPTTQAIEPIAEARELFRQYGLTDPEYPATQALTAAKLIAHVRQQSRNAALEEAAGVCEKQGRRSRLIDSIVRPLNDYDGKFDVSADASFYCMRAIRALVQSDALKDQQAAQEKRA